MREDTNSVVLVEPDPDRRRSLALRHAGLIPYAKLGEALDAESIDLAVVAVPVGASAGVVSKLLERNIPVLAEKPLTVSAEAAHELAAEARRHDALLTVGYIERFNPAVQALKAELASGSAGQIYHIHARRLSPFPYRLGMAGVATDVATHDLDVIGFITGSSPIRVYAEADVRHGGGAEDLLCASLRYANGVTALVESNWITPTKVRRLTVTTERGMYDVDYLTQDLWLHERASGDAKWDAIGVMRGANEGRTIRFALERREPLAIEHDRFFEAALTGQPPPVPADEAANTLSIAEAIVTSSQTHQPVELRAEAGSGSRRSST